MEFRLAEWGREPANVKERGQWDREEGPKGRSSGYEWDRARKGSDHVRGTGGDLGRVVRDKKAGLPPPTPVEVLGLVEVP